MAISKTYVAEELDWFEDRLREIKADIDATPYAQIEDRIQSLNNTKGFTETIAATAENQKKAQRDALKEYAVLLEMTNKLREEEENKQVNARGGAKINRQMEALVKGR